MLLWRPAEVADRADFGMGGGGGGGGIGMDMGSGGRSLVGASGITSTTSGCSIATSGSVLSLLLSVKEFGGGFGACLLVEGRATLS